MAIKKWTRSMFHVPHGIAYAVGNSRWGSRLARQLGFRWTDKDINVTKDGVAVYGHWPKIRMNGFHKLPKWFTDKYGHDPKISQVLWADLSKLVSDEINWRGKRRYRFKRADAEMIYAHSIGLNISNENKGDPRLRHKQFWEDLHAKTPQVPLSRKLVMTLPGMAGAVEVMQAAHEAGWPTMVIRANTGVPRSMKPYVTYYRTGPIKWIEG